MVGEVLAGWAFGVLVWAVGQSGGIAVGVEVEIFERVEAEELAAVVLEVAVAERVEL